MKNENKVFENKTILLSANSASPFMALKESANEKFPYH